MRARSGHPATFWISLLLIVVLAVVADGSLVLQGESAGTPTSLDSATAKPGARGPLLSDTRGFIALRGAGEPAELRRETDATSIGAPRGQGFIGAVSGTGRRVAYWVTTNGSTRELRVFDVTAPEQETALATVLATERGAAAVWSADRTGIVVVVESRGSDGTGKAPAPFSSLRLVDTPTRSIREISRVVDGSQYWPVGWDRVARRVGASVYTPDALSIAWIVVGEDALGTRVPMDGGIPVTTIRANGNDVLGVVGGNAIRLWTLSSYADHRDVLAISGERIAFARWRPGADEIVVLVADRLEIWPKAGGDRRTVAQGLPAATDLLVSSDGALAFVTFDGGTSATAIDLASGATTALPLSGSRLVAPISFR